LVNCLQIHLYTFWQDVSVSMAASEGYKTGGSAQFYVNIIPKCLQSLLFGGDTKMYAF